MAGLLGAGFLAAVAFLPGLRTRLRNFNNRHAAWLVPAIMGFVLAAGVFLAYRVVFTDAYLGHPWIDTKWAIAGKGWPAVARTSLAAMVIYLSPVLFGVFLAGLAMGAMRCWRG